MSPNSAKAQLYSTTLDHARRQALFNVANPATSKGSLNHVPNTSGGTPAPAAATGSGMDWKELLRKFTKHNPTREGELGQSGGDLSLQDRDRSRPR